METLFNGQVNYIDMKQTAVEWLIDQLQKHYVKQDFQNTVVFEQAKAMEKEQCEKMYEYAAWAMFYNGHGDTFEEYWNKTFKSE